MMSSSSKTPPVLPTRTPARTKRRSVSSTLSDPSTPTFDRSSAPVLPQDFSSVLSTPAPIIFSTSLERDLLNSMSALGLDTGQIVHSVLSDACDATGALWWMLKRKAERRLVEEGVKSSSVDVVESPEEMKPQDDVKQARHEEPRKERSKDKDGSERRSRDTPTRSPIPTALTQAVSAPELQLIPPTPIATTTTRPKTPPRANSPNALLSPTPSMADISIRSGPSTPGSSMRDKDKDQGSKGRKARSGSVSIMQRATTALEAAGLVRKKSAEGVRDSGDKRPANTEESRGSHGSSSSRLLKSPPLKPRDSGLPTTPPPSTSSVSVQADTGSPWVMAGNRSSPPPNGTDSPRDTLSALPNITGNKGSGGNRNRASLLSAFRLFFREDTKGKRKEEAFVDSPSVPYPRPLSSASPSTPGPGRGRGTVKRRGSGRGKMSIGRNTNTNNRSKRASASSRRSSSANSKRSSVQSTQFPTFDSPGYTNVSRRRSDASRRSFGSHTPNSELDELVSRPSSVQSFMGHRHRKSPSASSAGSMHPGRTASPLPKYHRRGGSGSSTRVVRQVHAPSHLRSNSASSVHSLTSSRPASIYELSESESRRNSSPNRPLGRRSIDDNQTPRRAHGQTAFVARKRETPFAHPTSSSSGYLSSLGRSSWKKSWGQEPPGWQTRASYSAIEVLDISPPVEGAPQGIRDVFSGRASLTLGDESDWVDEDDDGPGFAGGLGQMPSHAGLSMGAQSTYTTPLVQRPQVPLLSPAPRGHAGRAAGKRGNAPGLGTASGRTRSKGGRSPMGRTSPLPESSFEQAEQQRSGRRPLPASRSGPATIQEDDEGEEE